MALTPLRKCESCFDYGKTDDEEIPLAVMYCGECDQQICESCCQAHMKVKISKGHRLVDLKNQIEIEKLKLDLYDRLCDCNLKRTVEMFCSDCIRFKMALLAYKSIHGLAPEYLSAYCIPVSSLPGRSHLRSAGEWQLLVPRTKTVTLGPRGFFWACPSTWNTLPAPLRDFELSLDSFKRKLKSHFFTS